MAGQPTVAANAPTAAPNELAMLMQGYSPGTAVTAQRSQYLAQALAAMRSEGQNIRTPVALGSDLLAQALLQRKYGQSMQDFAQSARGDQQALAAPYQSWLDQQDGSQQPAGAPPAPAGPPAAAGPQPDASAPSPPQSATPAPQPDYAPNFGDPHQDPAAYFAAALGGKPVNITSGLRTPEHNRAVGGSPTSSHLTGNAWDFTTPGMTSAQAVDALRQSGMPFDQIIDEGRDVHVGMDPRMRGMVMAGNGGRYSVLDQDTFGPPQPSLASMSPASANPGVSMPGQPGPAQVSNSGQNATTPSPPPGPGPSAPPGGTASAPPAAPSPAAGGASAPQIYHQPVSPEEIATARQLLSSPRTYQQGLAYVQQLRERTAAPVKPEVNITREGQAIAYDPWNPTQTAAATNVPGWRGPLPAGWDRGPNGEAIPTAAVKYGPVGQVPGTSQLGQTGPDGQLHAGPQLDFGPTQRVGLSKELSGQLTSSPEYQKFTEARSAMLGFRNMVQAMAGKNNGVLDSAAMDSYLRGINPGASAKNTTVQMVMEHLGLPQEVQSAVLSATGNGYITPQTLQQMDQAMQAYTAAHGSEVQRIHQNHLAIASQAGIDEKGLGEDIGPIPQPMTLHFGGQPSPAQAGASARQTAQTAGASIANAAANLPRLSPQQAAQLPSGTRFVGLDGRERVRH